MKFIISKWNIIRVQDLSEIYPNKWNFIRPESEGNLLVENFFPVQDLDDWIYLTELSLQSIFIMSNVSEFARSDHLSSLSGMFDKFVLA